MLLFFDDRLNFVGSFSSKRRENAVRHCYNDHSVIAVRELISVCRANRLKHIKILGFKWLIKNVEERDRIDNCLPHTAVHSSYDGLYLFKVPNVIQLYQHNLNYISVHKKSATFHVLIFT
jgi:hypothetical protein